MKECRAGDSNQGRRDARGKDEDPREERRLQPLTSARPKEPSWPPSPEALLLRLSWRGCGGAVHPAAPSQRADEAEGELHALPAKRASTPILIPKGTGHSKGEGQRILRAPQRHIQTTEEAVSQGALTETPPQTVQGSWSWGKGHLSPRSGLWVLTCVESPKAQRQQGAAPDLGSARRPKGKPAKVAAASTAQYRGLKDPPPSSADTPAPPPRAGPGQLSLRPRPTRPGAPQSWFTRDKGFDAVRHLG